MPAPTHSPSRAIHHSVSPWLSRSKRSVAAKAGSGAMRGSGGVSWWASRVQSGRAGENSLATRSVTRSSRRSRPWAARVPHGPGEGVDGGAVAEQGMQGVMVGGEEDVAGAAGGPGRCREHVAEAHGGDAGEMIGPAGDRAGEQGMQIVDACGPRRGGGMGWVASPELVEASAMRRIVIVTLDDPLLRGTTSCGVECFGFARGGWRGRCAGGGLLPGVDEFVDEAQLGDDSGGKHEGIEIGLAHAAIDAVDGEG